MSKMDLIKALLKKRNIKEGAEKLLTKSVSKVAPKGTRVAKGVDDLERAISSPVEDLFRSIGITPKKASQEELDAAAKWFAQNQKTLNPEQSAKFKMNLERQTVSDDMRKMFSPAPVKTPDPTKVPSPSTKPGKVPTTKPTIEPATLPATQPGTLPVTKPATLPATQPGTLPVTKPATLPATQPGTLPVKPDTLPVTKPGTVVQPAVKVVTPEVSTATKTATETKTGTLTRTSTANKVPVDTTVKPPVPGIPIPRKRKVDGVDLRTMVSGTGVREEYIEEQEGFKKFKVMYILHGEEKTNVYRYKGKDTFAKARVLRQLRERGAGSIRFMQYESVEMDEAYMPDATRKPVVYRAPPKRGEVVGKMKVRLIRRHQDVMPGERTATSENTKRLRRLIRKVLRKGKLKKPN